MSTYFIGEMEFLSDEPILENFSSFAKLPHVDLVYQLASTSSDSVELMPYQAEGGGFKLMIAVYLDKIPTGTRLIVVLFREEYPQDLNGLKVSIQRALKRLSKLKANSVALEFQEESLFIAERNLEQFLKKLS